MHDLACLRPTTLQRRAALAALACAAVAPRLAVAGAQQADLLDLPAASTRHARRRLMLGVARAGRHTVAVGERGIALRVPDDGSPWSQARVPVSVTLTALQFIDERHGWAVGHDGVALATDDGGATWQRRFDGRLANQLVLAAAEALQAAPATAGGAAAEQARFALEDAKSGAAFGPTRPLLGLHFRSPQRGWLIGSYGQIFQTTDGGAHWATAVNRTGNHERLHLNAITADTEGRLVVAAEAGKLYRSDDDGLSWREQESGSPGALYGVIDLGGPGLRSLLAFGFGGRVFRSDDAGARWRTVAGEPRRRTLVAGMRAPQQGAMQQGALLLAQDGELWWSRGDDSALLRIGRAALSRCAALAPGADASQVVVAGSEGLATVAMVWPKA